MVLHVGTSLCASAVREEKENVICMEAVTPIPSLQK